MKWILVNKVIRMDYCGKIKLSWEDQGDDLSENIYTNYWGIQLEPIIDDNVSSGCMLRCHEAQRGLSSSS